MKYLTTEEVRQRLGLKHRTTVNGYITRGYLKAKKFGSVWMVSEESVQKRLEEHGQVETGE